jgi:hypothetical protein
MGRGLRHFTLGREFRNRSALWTNQHSNWFHFQKFRLRLTTASRRKWVGQKPPLAVGSSPSSARANVRTALFGCQGAPGTSRT